MNMRINNSSNKFDTGHGPIKVKVTASLCLFLLDFLNCSERFNIQSEGSISQLWNTVGR